MDFKTKTIILFSTGLVLFTPASFSASLAEQNIALVNAFNAEVFEQRYVDSLDKYLAKDIIFYNNFDAPADYKTLQKHLAAFASNYSSCKVFPIDISFSTEDKVVSLYTQRCINKSNGLERRRLMVISEINKANKIAKIWVVSHEK